MSNIESLKRVLAEVEETVQKTHQAQLEINRERNRIAKIVSDATSTLEPVDDDFVEDEIHELLSDFAYRIDRQWTGDWDYGVWSLGERAEFWIPSTC